MFGTGWCKNLSRLTPQYILEHVLSSTSLRCSNNSISPKSRNSSQETNPITIANELSSSIIPLQVTDIQCSFSSQGSVVGDSITATLKKPQGFKGAPLFADDRNVNPEADYTCAIKQDPDDPTELTYSLSILDFTRCGVLRRNGFVHVRIWFPQFPGVVMQADQELIIMCKPPEPTVIQNKAAGFAGSL